MPAPEPAAAPTSHTASATVANAAAASMPRAACAGGAPSATGTAIAIGKPGGKCPSAVVLSASDQVADGIRSAPCRTSDSAAPMYDMVSGSSPGPGGSVIARTP